MKNGRLLFLLIMAASLIEGRSVLAWDSAKAFEGHVQVASPTSARKGARRVLGQLDPGDPSSGDADSVNPPQDEDGGDVAADERVTRYILSCMEEIPVKRKAKSGKISIERTRTGFTAIVGTKKIKFGTQKQGEFGTGIIGGEDLSPQEIHTIFRPLCG